MLINPYKALGALMAKSAADFNIPAYQAPQPAAPQMSQEQIQNLLGNIRSYPPEQQQAIYDAINKQFEQSSYNVADNSKGILGNAWSSLTGKLNDWRTGAIDAYRSAMGSAQKNLFGTSSYDPTAQDRYRASVVMQNAVKNPEMFKKLQDNLQAYVKPTAKPTATTSAPAPAPAPAAAALTPAPTAPVTPPAAPAPAAPAPNPEPWKDPKSKFNPNWTAQQRQDYIRNKYGETTEAEKARSAELSKKYNPPAPAQTTDRWGRKLQNYK